jgi:hypothetical protein
VADRLTRLRDLADSLQADLAGCESLRDKAALGRLYADVLAQIEACEKAAPEQKGTALDEFAKRRAERETKSPAVPAKRVQRGR